MRQRLQGAAWVLVILVGCWGCAAPRIVGKATVVGEPGAPPAGVPAPGVTVNFINLGGAIEESVVSVQTDAKGKYSSPELAPGKYQVEAMLPGYVIGKATVVLKKHGKKNTPFALKKIQETAGRSVRESESENIPTPGEAKIEPPR